MPEIVLPLTVRSLTSRDLLACGWSGIDLADRAKSLERAQYGEVEYLAVCPPSDIPIATGGVDYAGAAGVATLWQLSVNKALRSCGIGTILIQALEDRIRNRGLPTAELAVDENDPRPRAMYERLGYVAFGRRSECWDQQQPNGSVTRYETVLTLMRKELS